MLIFREGINKIMKRLEADRRVRKTKAVLRQEFTKLLVKKELKNISVKELTELADINRGTFYLHYKDIYDLFEKIEDEVLFEFIEIIDKYKKQEQMSWISVLLDLFKYIAVNADIFIAILRTSDSTFLTRIIEINKPKTKSEWNKLFTNGKEQYYDYYYAFITQGCIAMVKSWFMDGMNETPEEMAALSSKLMMNCIMKLS